MFEMSHADLKEWSASAVNVACDIAFERSKLCLFASFRQHHRNLEQNFDVLMTNSAFEELDLPHFDFQVTLNAVCWWCCLIQMPRSSWWCTEWKVGCGYSVWFPQRGSEEAPFLFHSIFEVYWKYIRGKFQFDIHPRALPDLPAAEEARNTFCTSFNDTQKTKDPWIRRLLFILYHFLRWSRKDSLSFALF